MIRWILGGLLVLSAGYFLMPFFGFNHGKVADGGEKQGTPFAIDRAAPEVAEAPFDGKRAMKYAAKGLHRLHRKIDLLATSPLKRAVQTAEILYAAYDDEPQFLELELLAGGKHPKELIAWLKGKDLDASTVALVGHEPDLSRWAGFFVTGKMQGIVTMKKGAACVIDFPALPAAGKGVIAGLYRAGDFRR